MPVWEIANLRMPILKEAVYPSLTNSPDTFTPDGKWIIGETPEVCELFIIKYIKAQKNLSIVFQIKIYFCR